MAKLGVITDGISRDFEKALQVMTDAGLEYAELQYLWEKEVGDLNDDEMARAKDLVERYGVKVSCISSHAHGTAGPITNCPQRSSSC